MGFKCDDCSIARDGINYVPGEGGENPEVFFIGRDPGVQENTLMKPFVGPSGKFLRPELEHFFNDEKIFITNMVKCHTRDNIGPTRHELRACRSKLKFELNEYQPTYLVALGKTVFVTLMSDHFYIDIVAYKDMKMSELSGNVYDVKLFGRYYKLVPTYHPSPRNMDKYEEIRRVLGMVAELVS